MESSRSATSFCTSSTCFPTSLWASYSFCWKKMLEEDHSLLLPLQLPLSFASSCLSLPSSDLIPRLKVHIYIRGDISSKKKKERQNVYRVGRSVHTRSPNTKNSSSKSTFCLMASCSSLFGTMFGASSRETLESPKMPSPLDRGREVGIRTHPSPRRTVVHLRGQKIRALSPLLHLLLPFLIPPVLTPAGPTSFAPASAVSADRMKLTSTASATGAFDVAPLEPGLAVLYFFSCPFFSIPARSILPCPTWKPYKSRVCGDRTFLKSAGVATRAFLRSSSFFERLGFALCEIHYQRRQTDKK